MSSRSPLYLPSPLAPVSVPLADDEPLVSMATAASARCPGHDPAPDTSVAGPFALCSSLLRSCCLSAPASWRLLSRCLCCAVTWRAAPRSPCQALPSSSNPLCPCRNGSRLFPLPPVCSASLPPSWRSLGSSSLVALRLHCGAMSLDVVLSPVALPTHSLPFIAALLNAHRASYIHSLSTFPFPFLESPLIPLEPIGSMCIRTNLSPHSCSYPYPTLCLL